MNLVPAEVEVEDGLVDASRRGVEVESVCEGVATNIIKQRKTCFSSIS
jgi:hypothetical protein